MHTGRGMGFMGSFSESVRTIIRNEIFDRNFLHSNVNLTGLNWKSLEDYGGIVKSPKQGLKNHAEW